MYNPYYYPSSTTYQYNPTPTPYYYVSQPQYVIQDSNLDATKSRLRTNIENIQDYSSHDQRGRIYVIPEKQKPAVSQERNRKNLVEVSAVVKTEPSFPNPSVQLKTGQKATILQDNINFKEENLKVEPRKKIGKIEMQNSFEKGRTTDKIVEEKKNVNAASIIQVQSIKKNEIKVNTEATNSSNQHKMEALKRVAPPSANINKKPESCFLIQIPNEGHFEGITKENKKNGYGVFRDLNEKEIYNGEWLEDVFHGMGILKNDKSQNFDGLYDFKKLVNLGLQWKSYEGEFKKGKPHGLGTLTLSNGEKFNGLWEDGNINGEGFFEDKDGKIRVVGRWEKGLMVKVL